MEKVKLTAKQAQEVMKTDGKEWLLNAIFKTIRQAAEHGEDKIVWDFTPNFEVADEIKDILYDMGYTIGENGDIDNFVCEISWGYDNFEDFITDVSEKWDDFSQAEKEELATAISSAEKLTHISKTKGRAYLLTEARRAIMQAAYIGRNSTIIDLLNISLNNINWLFDQLKNDGFNVSYLNDEHAARITF